MWSLNYLRSICTRMHVLVVVSPSVYIPRSTGKQPGSIFLMQQKLTALKK